MVSFSSPFRKAELVGYFTWDSDLTDLFPRSSWIYHACHKKRFRMFERMDELFVYSHFNVLGSRDGCSTYDCAWASIQPWHETHGHNHFGPLTIKIPLSRLDGRRFYVFQRELRGWTHYYLVQRESKKPLFGTGSKAESIRPKLLFGKTKALAEMGFKARTQYEIVLTAPLRLKNASFIATAHNHCAMGHCNGIAKNIAKTTIGNTVHRKLEKLAARFPQFKSRILCGIDS